MEMTPLAQAYRGRRVLITGHTGFKGSWLALWLESLGAHVHGVALAPVAQPNHWDQLALRIEEQRIDIRDGSRLAAYVSDVQPDIVFHLAAQALVRRAYVDPLETWSSNVLGTANVLEACRGVASLRGVVVVTTDKCYENREWEWGYRETDVLGGSDPYSASKAATELLTISHRRSFYSAEGAPLLATARAGNVVGGGDWAADRLIPDAVRAVMARAPLTIRFPHATRPWQHVLDCLHGYLLLGAKLVAGERSFADAWNFGPDHRSSVAVSRVLGIMKEHWPELDWRMSKDSNPKEAGQLRLDASRARNQLGWAPVWDLEQSIEATARWYRRYLQSGEVASRDQLHEFIRAAGA